MGEKGSAFQRRGSSERERAKDFCRRMLRCRNAEKKKKDRKKENNRIYIYIYERMPSYFRFVTQIFNFTF